MPEKIPHTDHLLFDTLFDKHYPGLLLYATQFLPENEAEDVVQDSFVELWKRRAELNTGEHIRAYLYRTVYSRCINILRHKYVQSRYSEAQKTLHEHKAAFLHPDENNEIIRRIENRELARQINAAIRLLPDKCKEVFVLSYLHGMKNKAIAEKLNIAPRTVEAHMYKALKILREALKHLATLPLLITYELFRLLLAP